jgi:predicted transcriptional regulator
MSLSPEVKKAIKDLVGEVSNSMTRMEAERDLIKEAISSIAKDHELDKKILRKMCRTYHKQRFHTEKQDNEKFEETYSDVFDVIEDNEDNGDE